MRNDLEVEASRRGNELQEAQAKVAGLSSQVKFLRKELQLLRGQSTKFEARALKAEEEVFPLKHELPKCLKESANEAVENFQHSEAFQMQAVLWTHDTGCSF